MRAKKHDIFESDEGHVAVVLKVWRDGCSGFGWRSDGSSYGWSDDRDFSPSEGWRYADDYDARWAEYCAMILTGEAE